VDYVRLAHRARISLCTDHPDRARGLNQPAELSELIEVGNLFDSHEDEVKRRLGVKPGAPGAQLGFEPGVAESSEPDRTARTDAELVQA
jgi:hypothetical protein